VGRISNFGIAKPAIDTGGVTATNFNTLDVVGTLGYMSPEYLRGLSLKVDTFAFGLFVLEVLTGYSINNPAPGYKNLLLMFEDEFDSPDKLCRTLTQLLAGNCTNQSVSVHFTTSPTAASICGAIAAQQLST